MLATVPGVGFVGVIGVIGHGILSVISDDGHLRDKIPIREGFHADWLSRNTHQEVICGLVS